MTNFRLSRGLCAAVGDMIGSQYSHIQGEALFQSAGAPGEAPNLSHRDKWKEWMFRAGKDDSVDSLEVLGNILEEFMDTRPVAEEAQGSWFQAKEEIEHQLSLLGLTYYGCGRVMLTGTNPYSADFQETSETTVEIVNITPSSADEVIARVAKSLPRAMYPLTHRRKNATPLTFSSEYDIQDLFHALIQPWIKDVRPEEYCPSYAGSNSRLDFLLPQHSTVVELKFVRDKSHAKNVGKELTIDIAHYTKHPRCSKLWCVIFDPGKSLQNPDGLKNDLEGKHDKSGDAVEVKVLII